MVVRVTFSYDPNEDNVTEAEYKMLAEGIALLGGYDIEMVTDASSPEFQPERRMKKPRG